ncbi:MAG: chorismate synthase [Flavobacteriales bacterium]|nr:chorismate synthase [Flavobacteriales bacterium]
MAGNSFGKTFVLSTFGESHGSAIGGIIDGCPAGVEIDINFIQHQLDRRKPGQSKITTQRKESDTVQLLSGIFEGKTTGTPIGFIIQNEDPKSKDYSHIAHSFRPSHADFTYQEKYGHRDYRGGGRSSARETACRVVAGGIALQVLKHWGVSIHSFVQRVHHIEVEQDISTLDFSLIDSNDVRCPDPITAQKMYDFIDQTRKEGDTVGGTIACVIKGAPAAWGEPVFDKLHADLGKAMLSINAAKGFEIGSGFSGTYLKGSEHNDLFELREGKTRTKTNRSGGIQGGISNGEDIHFKVGFKPIATIMHDQQSVNEAGEEVLVKGKGRHDPCVLPRAVPIVDAMAALVMVDHALRSRSNQI